MTDQSHSLVADFLAPFSIALDRTFRLADRGRCFGGEALCGGFANLANPAVLVFAKPSFGMQFLVDRFATSGLLGAVSRRQFGPTSLATGNS